MVVKIGEGTPEPTKPPYPDGKEPAEDKKSTEAKKTESTPPPPTPPAPADSKSYSGEEVRGLISELRDSFTEDLKKRDDIIGDLVKAADQGRLSKVRSQKEGPIVRQVHITLSQDRERMVVGWKTIEDKVYKDVVKGLYHEIQVMRVFFDDDSKKDMSYELFTRLRDNRVSCDVVARTEDDKGNIVFKLKRLDNGKVLELDQAFVN